MKLVLKALALVLALSLLLIGGALAVYWQSDQPVAALTAKWAPAPSRFLPVDGMRVHMRDEGPRDDPHPIVLLHGTSASLHTWQGWSDALTPQRRVIRLDLPGFGLTGPFPDDDYTLSHYVRFMTHFLDAVGVGQVVLAGNSFGGNVAWRTAAANPARVQKLLLVDAAGYAYKPKSVPISFRMARMPLLRPIGEHLLARSMVQSSLRNVYGDPSKVTPGLVDRYYDLALREGNRHALSERFRQVQPGEEIGQLARLTVPTLILWGAEDRLNPKQNGERFAHDIPGSQLIVLERLGHVPHEEDPVRSLAAARPFVAAK
ncbi:MAG: alpha/beta hydrolase [Myxococcaceae bacterium]|nr:alpha/beta hydrolase [Myxococcaceae bacterium]